MIVMLIKSGNEWMLRKIVIMMLIFRAGILKRVITIWKKMTKRKKEKRVEKDEEEESYSYAR